MGTLRDEQLAAIRHWIGSDVEPDFVVRIPFPRISAMITFRSRQAPASSSFSERFRDGRFSTEIAASDSEFSLTEVRYLVRDLFQPKPWIYWTDFLLSFGLGLIAFHGVRNFDLFSWQQMACYAMSVVCYYRSVLFIHELIHLRDKSFHAFRFVWNLLCGIPFLTPTFTYYTHVDHHMRKHYGTAHDGEYLPLATQSPIHLLYYFCQPFFMPILAVVRFLVFVPLSWVSRRFRDFAHARMSSMIINLNYVRPLPTDKQRRSFRLQELGCFLFLLAATALIIRGRGQFTPMLVVQAYLTAVGVLMLNHIRTLGAHRYINGSGEEMTFVEQLLDSVNYPQARPWLVLSMPVGLRYHALHHLCPSLPYHALGAAHRRLMAELPANSPYRKTVSPSLWQSLASLWRASRAAAGQDASRLRAHDRMNAMSAQ